MFARWWLALVVLVMACDRPSFEPGGATAVTADVSCTCAYCTDSQFCYDPDDPTRTEPFDPARGCRGATSALAERATRLVVGADGRFTTESFFCIPPSAESTLGAASPPGTPAGTCPTDPLALRQAQFVDACEDVPLCRRRAEGIDRERFIDCDFTNTTGELCPGGARSLDEKYTHPSETICRAPLGDDRAATEAALRSDAVQLCAHYHGDEPVPTVVQRYCFLSCATLSGVANCDAALFDPPHIAQDGALFLEIGSDPHGALSSATVGVLGDSASIGVEGTVYLSALDCQPGIGCRASVSFVDLRGIGSLEVAGFTVSNIVLRNALPMPDAITPIDADRSSLYIDPGGVLFTTGDIAGLEGRRGDALTLRTPLIGELDWTGHSFSVGTVLSDDASGLSITLTLRGRIRSIPPLANAGPDQVVECGSPDGTAVELSAAGSVDRDGDIVAYSWLGAGGALVGTTAEASVDLPIGDHSFRARVVDAAGQADSDRTDVSVVDTQGPIFDAAQMATDCLWPPDHSLHLFRLGTELVATARDACDGAESTVRIVDVVSDQPEDDLGDGTTAPDVRFGEAAFCLRGERTGTSSRPRGYTVVLESTDAAGNTTLSEVVIRVPHDQRPSDRCTTGGLAPAVADDDPRCEAPLEAPPPTPPGALPNAGGGGCSVGPGRPSGALWIALLLAAFTIVRRRRA